jgi:serine/threonine protein kinase
MVAAAGSYCRLGAVTTMEVDLRSGSRLGRYELLVALGVGGMATVWIAREASDVGDRLVALKAMLPELAQQPDFRTMFLEEGQVVRSIDHPNVVRVHEVGEDRGTLFMAMEWVRGDSLKTIIREAKKGRAVPSEMAVRIIADTASGLHAAHELRGWDGELRNLVHCDVSPHNILVGVDGRARLVDFGVANGTAHSDPDTGDQVKGKYGYMSPEQASGERIDRRSDVFALGIVLFELTTGERLFRGETPAHTLRLVQAARIPNPARLVPGYPARLAEIVQRSLEREMTQRYQTADELRAALEQYLVEERVVVSHASVGKLVYRVLKPRLDQQDEQLRVALVAADGMVQAGLVPDARGVEAPTRWNRLSDPPTSSHPSSGGGPFQHTLGTRPPQERRAPVGALLFAALGVGCAVASIVWTSLQEKPNALVTAPGGPSVPTGSEAREASASPTSVSGVSLDSIPVAAPLEPARPGHQGGSRRGTASVTGTKVTLEDDPVSPPAAKTTPQLKVELEETPGKPAAPLKTAAVNPPAPSIAAPVELEEQETTPGRVVVPPPSERSAFSVGSARAALATATSRATACKSTDGPSGAGRVTVVFSPDGPVSSVSVAPPFGGTGVGTCVSTAFRNARVPPFTGSPVTLSQSFRIP